MREIIAMILMIMICSSAAGQLISPIDNEGEPFQSARLQAMGQASIANPDLQTEMFINPARMMQNTRLFLFAGPVFSRQPYTIDQNESLSQIYNDSYYYNEKITEMTLGAIAGGCGSIGPVAVGGYITHTNFSIDESADIYNSGFDEMYSYEERERFTGTLSTPYTEATLQAGTSLGPVSVGVGGTLFGGTGTIETKMNGSGSYLEPPNPIELDSSSSEDKSEQMLKGRSLTAGTLFTLADLVEVSVSAKFTSGDTEDKETQSVQDGVVQNATELTNNLLHFNIQAYRANIRYPLTEFITLGSRLTYSLTNHDYSTQTRWDFPDVYAERPTEKIKDTYIQGGIGAAFRTSSSSLFSAEFLLGTLTMKGQGFETDSVEINTRTFAPGDLYREVTATYHLRTLRIAGEYDILSMLKCRLGVEYVWTTLDEEGWTFDRANRETRSGEPFGRLFPSAGISIGLESIRIDYALSTFSPESTSDDFAFRHFATVTIEL